MPERTEHELVLPDDYNESLVLGGGGLSAVYGMAVLHAMEDAGITSETFGAVFSESGGSANAGAYLSSNAAEGVAHYLDNLSGDECVDMKPWGPKFDLDEVARRGDHLIEEPKILAATSPELHIAVTEAASAEPVFLAPKEGETHDRLKASASIPFLTKSVMIEGKAYYDGTFSHAIPYSEAVAATKGLVTVVLNVGLESGADQGALAGFLGSQASRLGAAISVMTEQETIRTISLLLKYPKLQNENLARLRGLVSDPESNVRVIAPSNPEEQISPVETCKDKMVVAARMGYADAAAAIDDINPNNNPY